MCGRYALSANAQDIALEFGIDGEPEAFLPSDWNIAPTKNVYVVTAKDHAGKQRNLDIATWGLVPNWAKDTSRSSNSINARIESVAEKPTFRFAFKSHRCLVPADGYYEWATEVGPFKPKQPFYIKNTNGSLLSLAGIYESWLNPQTGKELVSFSIITRESTGSIAKIHHRMPVILPQDRWAKWLSCDVLTKEQIPDYLGLLELPNPDQGLIAIPVSTAVNNARNHGPELAKEIELNDSGTLF